MSNRLPHTDVEFCKAWVAAVRAGHGYKEIAATLGVSIHSAQRTAQRLRKAKVVLPQLARSTRKEAPDADALNTLIAEQAAEPDEVK